MRFFGRKLPQNDMEKSPLPRGEREEIVSELKRTYNFGCGWQNRSLWEMGKNKKIFFNKLFVIILACAHHGRFSFLYVKGEGWGELNGWKVEGFVSKKDDKTLGR